jgi:hypothetical protein
VRLGGGLVRLGGAGRRGPVEVSLKYDEEIRKAIAVLNNPAQFKKILNR